MYHKRVGYSIDTVKVIYENAYTTEKKDSTFYIVISKKTSDLM